MKSVNIHEAKTHLSRLLELVELGEPVVIARNGRPIARIVPFTSEPRKPGRLRGKIRIGDDFEDPLPEDLAAAFRGESE
jgi:prevent-host-death family protein